jgi:hypothetical protein
MVCQAVTTRYGHRSLHDDPANPERVTGQTRVPFYDAVFTAVYATHGDSGIVSDGQSEDRKFWEATPSGKFEVSTVREMPWEPGKSYYIDVTEAPEN